MSTQTQTVTMTDSYKEAVVNRDTQPGLEAVWPNGPGYGGAYGRGSLNQPPLIPVDATAQVATATGGLKKKVFWLWFALVVLGVVVLGLSVGLGVGLRKLNDSDSSGQPSTSPDLDDLPNNATSTSTCSATPPSTVTITSLPSSTSTSSSSKPSTPCPSGNNTIITSSVGTIRYRLRCDADFTGNAKKTLASIVLSSFDDCLSLCNGMNWFQDREDVGATFNVAGTGRQSEGTCWCLGGEGKVVGENVGNDAAVPIGGSD